MLQLIAPLLIALSLVATAPAASPDTIELIPVGDTVLSTGRGIYEGTLEVSARPDGLAVVETSALDAYLTGIREVPASWPDATLDAQAIAARTYLAWTLHRGRSIRGERYGFDICASTVCQVYVGPGSAPRSWAAAVTRTTDEILVYDGAPAQALYSSSAGARTRAVQDIWGGSGVPYLQPVDSREVEPTPNARWELVLSAGEFLRVLAAGGYDAGGRVESVGVVSPGEGAGPASVEVQTERGITRIPVSAFRGVFNRYGPELYPGLIPATRPGGGKWPQAILSYTFDIECQAAPVIFDGPVPPSDLLPGGRLTIIGEGWGHGVGMSQWGARAMGGAGATGAEILEHYYGLTPRSAPDLVPEEVRVGLAWGEKEVTVVASGPFEMRVDGLLVGVLIAGEWKLVAMGGGIAIEGPTDADPRMYRSWRGRLRPR